MQAALAAMDRLIKRLDGGGPKVAGDYKCQLCSKFWRGVERSTPLKHLKREHGCTDKPTKSPDQFREQRREYMRGWREVRARPRRVEPPHKLLNIFSVSLLPSGTAHDRACSRPHGPLTTAGGHDGRPTTPPCPCRSVLWAGFVSSSVSDAASDPCSLRWCQGGSVRWCSRPGGAGACVDGRGHSITGERQ